MSELIFAIIIIVVLTFAVAGYMAAPWLPTRRRERKILLEKVNVQDESIVYDLGCGDGSVLFDFAKTYKKTTFIGFEISLLPYCIAKLRKLFNYKKYKNVKIKYRNLFTQPLNDADIVFVFLLSKSYKKLYKKFSSELKPDCLVIVEAWPIDGILPITSFRQKDSLPIYVYKGSRFT
ncbi:class I SAM-dependent methyltransferase [Candidatus Falkowbacteria bacterium]|jgi:precorrin-6B methylase 2|nr:class I SAM-dependent methyltransferase [Candidatus Falkowbacteria bacterium]MBT7007349.1 class I SAM-dependent methyltransferase [Candidatus Falkowbacteria bacterium]